MVRLEESLSDEFSETFHHKRWSSELHSDGAESNIGVAVIIRTKINGRTCTNSRMGIGHILLNQFLDNFNPSADYVICEFKCISNCITFV